MRNQVLRRLFYLLMWSIFSPLGVYSQTLTINGNDLFHVAPGEIVASVGGFKFVGTSGASKISFPKVTRASNNLPNSYRTLVSNSSAIYEIRNVGQNETADFYLDLPLASNSALVDVSIENKSSTAKFQVNVAGVERSDFNDLPVEWTLSKINALSTDFHTLTFKWDDDLEPNLIQSKRLYVYDNTLTNWIELPVNKTTIDETQNVLTYTNFEGSLSGTRFMIAASSVPNADLLALTTTADQFSPIFDASILSYTAKVSSTTTSINLTPTVADAYSTIMVNGTSIASGQNASITINEGTNTITIVVTASDGITTKNYTLTVTRPVLPAAPTQLVTSVNNNAVDINFTPGASGTSSITNYKYSLDNGVNWIALTPADTESPVRITGLSFGSNYTIQLRAVSADGDGAISDAVTESTPIIAPLEPTNLVASAYDGLVDIAFTPSTDGGSAITNYEYSIDNGTNWIAFSPAQTTSPLSINGLTNGTAYTVKLRAVSAIGTGAESTAVTATPAVGSDMVLVFDTRLDPAANNTIGLPLQTHYTNGSYAQVEINWGDGTTNTYAGAFNFYQHTYSVAGEYTVKIKGLAADGKSLWRYGYYIPNTYPKSPNEIYLNTDRKMLTKVKSFGSLGIVSLDYAFLREINLTEMPGTFPTSVTTLHWTFRGASNFNGDLNTWNVSNVVSMIATFQDASKFNGDITGWNVSNVTDMTEMFKGASAFNQNISGWDVSKVTTMYSMFSGASSFNQDLGAAGTWDVSNVTNMFTMFLDASKFNGDLSNWNVSKVTDMRGMFRGATVFNRDIGQWDVSNVIYMSGMFLNAKAFNQNIGSWNVAKITDLSSMFSGASAFNQDIGSWNVSNVSTMTNMFNGATAFNKYIGGWNVSKVTIMWRMFMGATSFNQNIGSWNVGMVTNMGDMFYNATSFNQNIGSWQVGTVTDMSSMFNGATSFNQNISGWNISNVTTMYNMFFGVTLSRSNYDEILKAWSAKTVKSGVSFHAGNSKYSPGAAETARTALRTSPKSWSITDGGVDNTPAAPTALSATVGDAKLIISFTPGAQNGSTITNYQYSTNGGSTWTAFSPLVTTSPVTITGLTNGTSYDVKLRAVNTSGAGDPSATVTASPVAPPVAPTGLIATVGDRQVSLTFNTGETNITNYEYSLDNGTNWIAFSPAITSSPATITNLTNGTSYDIKLRGVNIGGPGVASTAVTVTPVTIPSAPTSLTVTVGKDGELDIAFTQVNNSGTAITNYEYSLDGGTSWIVLDPAKITSPVSITGLTNGTSYDVLLRAVNAVGSGAASEKVTATPITVSTAPTNLTATVGDSQVEISFTAGNNGGTAVTNYEYSLNGGTTWTAFSPAATSSPLTITGLTNGTSYDIKLRAINAVGAGESSATQTLIPVTVPAAPTSLTATVGKDGQLDIAFTQVNTSGTAITNYEYSLDGGTSWIALNPAKNTSPVTITGLTNGSEYDILLRALNAVGASVASVKVTETPLTVPFAPSNLNFSPDDGQIEINFTAGDNGGTIITNYEYSLDGGTTWTAFNPVQNSSPLTITGLTNGATYDIQIRGLNSIGVGLASTVQSVITYKDTDGDGVPDLIEDREKTDSSDAKDFKDSDGDGVPDYVEVKDASNPNDGSEFIDTDSDGVPDYVENILWPNLGLPGADPNDPLDANRDTDKDGVPDYQELLENTQANDSVSFKDSDGDGVPDYIEEQQRTDPNDANDWKDTDDDGIPDYIEDQQGTDSNNPADSKDTDRDGVPDYIEDQQGTDKNQPGDKLLDSDGDGVPDYIEDQQGTDPNDPNDSRDTDNDGIPDYIEDQQGTDSNDPTDSKDTDGDGVPDYIEDQQGTDKNQAGDKLIDSDGDGVPDYIEVQQGTDPKDPNDSKDTDNDGIPDYIEDQQGTDINDPTDSKDTDGDGIPDYIEEQQGTDKNQAGDKLIDSDGDGVPDYIEEQQGTDPKDPNDSRDSDNDGIPDYIEDQQGTDLNDPTDSKDSDGDGVPDYIEDQQGTDKNQSGDKLIDSDGDGVPDYIEEQQGTDPKNTSDSRDTDGDGVPDYIEEQQGTDPKDANDSKDTDNDGVPDYIENQQGTDSNDPTDSKDTDGDGVPDYIEEQQGTDKDQAGDKLIDSDGDGVPDYIEEQQGTDPKDPNDSKDTDNDGIPDYIEDQQGTDSNDPTDSKDTDGDGVPDYIEEQQGTDKNQAGDKLIDSDGDGVPDYIEEQQGTDPKDPNDSRDTDGDGIPDYIEDQQGTDSNDQNDSKDTDGDGIPDYIEEQQGTDKNQAGDKLIDSDGDGVPDYIEEQQGTDPKDPNDSRDTDGDGIPDYIEDQQGTDLNDPTDSKDTDGDGVADYIEEQQGTDKNQAGDKLIDSDGDGVPDYIEEQQGTNPRDTSDSRDTDADGVPDYIEEQQGTDLKDANASKDTDNDGIPDYIEDQQGTDPNNPTDSKDSDGDGLADYIEEQQGTDKNQPGDKLIDTDSDGVPDYIEKQQGTDPAKADQARDSDGDGLSDYYESKNTAPSDIMLSETTIFENSALGSILAQISSLDQLDPYVHSYSLVSGSGDTDNAKFEIVGNELKIKEVFDFEKKSSYSLRIRTTDAGSLSYEKSFTITIKDVNEAPTKLTLSKQNIYEENNVADLIGLLSTTDVDAGDTYSYTLVSGIGSTDNGSFTISGGQLRAAQSFKYATKNSYSVRIRTTDRGGLSTEQQFSISISEKPVIRGTGNETYPFTRTAASSNPSISLGYSSQLNVSGSDIVSYNWIPSTGLSATTISNPEAKPKVTTIYSVEVTNRFGSKTTVSITVTVREDYNVTPTNLISPNGDGVNDVWVIENLESYPNNKVSIFDRAGRLIYSKSNYNNDWNGQFNGIDLPEDTYYYIILLDGGKGEKKGFITLVK